MQEITLKTERFQEEAREAEPKEEEEARPKEARTKRVAAERTRKGKEEVEERIKERTTATDGRWSLIQEAIQLLIAKRPRLARTE